MGFVLCTAWTGMYFYSHIKGLSHDLTHDIHISNALGPDRKKKVAWFAIHFHWLLSHEPSTGLAHALRAESAVSKQCNMTCTLYVHVIQWITRENRMVLYVWPWIVYIHVYHLRRYRDETHHVTHALSHENLTYTILLNLASLMHTQSHIFMFQTDMMMPNISQWQLIKK